MSTAPPQTQDDGFQDVEAARASTHIGARGDDYMPLAAPLEDVGGERPQGCMVADYEAVVRHGFVRKVLGIVGLQLFVTFGYCIFCTYHHATRLYLQKNLWPFWVGVSVSLVTILGLICFQQLTRSYPHNYIFISVFTIAMTLMLGSFSAMTNSVQIITAIGATMGVVVVLFVFAFQTKYDFTSGGPYLTCALWSVLIYSIIGSIVGFVTGWFYGLLATILFSFFIVYDLQLILGGKEKLAIGVDDYVFAAIMLYVDIINLFVHILRCLKEFR